MILEHIADETGLLIKWAATFNSDAFGSSDLNVIDEVAVPDGLKDTVAEPEDEDVLHRLLPEVVVDTENLIF